MTGNAAKRDPRIVKRPTDVTQASQEGLKPSQGLTDEELAVWRELAPLAIDQRTLTAASAMAFADLCAYILMERRMRIAPLAVGGPDHRGMIQRVENLRARFRLVPDGKSVAAPQQAEDEWAEFDAPKVVPMVKPA